MSVWPTSGVGGRLNVTQLKRDLRPCGAAGVYPLEKISSKDLARQHFVFMAWLVYAAGYSGWGDPSMS